MLIQTEAKNQTNICHESFHCQLMKNSGPEKNYLVKKCNVMINMRQDRLPTFQSLQIKNSFVKNTKKL